MPASHHTHMGFRLRRSIKILPGVRWNVGLRGSSISVGGRGATLNFSKRGTRATVGIPGTGLSYSENIGSRGRSTRAESNPVSNGIPIDPDALGIPRVTWKFAVGVMSVGVFLLWPVWGMLGLLVTALLPGRRAAARRELNRRLQLLQAAAATLNPSSSVDDVDEVLAFAAELQVPPELVSNLTESLTALREVIALERAGGPLVAIDGAQDVMGPEPCHFFAPVFLDKHGADENGTVYLGSEHLLFVGDTRLALPWSKIVSVAHVDRTLVVQRSDRRTPYRFVFAALGLAARASWFADTLSGKSTPARQ